MGRLQQADFVVVPQVTHRNTAAPGKPADRLQFRPA